MHFLEKIRLLSKLQLNNNYQFNVYRASTLVLVFLLGYVECEKLDELTLSLMNIVNYVRVSLLEQEYANAISGFDTIIRFK